MSSKASTSKKAGTKAGAHHEVGPLVVLFGGFCDSIFEPAKSAKKHLKNYFGECKDLFFSWDEEEEALAAIKHYRKGMPSGSPWSATATAARPPCRLPSSWGTSRSSASSPSTRPPTSRPIGRTTSKSGLISTSSESTTPPTSSHPWRQLGIPEGGRPQRRCHRQRAGEKSEMEEEKNPGEVVVVAPKVTHGSVLGMLNILKGRSYLPMKPKR